MSNATQQLKAQQRRQKFADLLREMFQLNQPELDFGLYRIMHARKDDVNRFIEKDLPSITQKAFQDFASQDKTAIEKELQETVEGLEKAKVNPETNEYVQELKAKLRDDFDLAREEGEVYDALLTFFSRYYNEGDFLSRRVYKDGTYAIPYQGEEVVLHWANKDQYYIKSSETLRDYSFRLNPDAGPGEDPMRVHFKLVDAEAGAKDNNKESADSRRVFLLDVEKPFALIEGEATEHGDQNTELQCRFVFRPATESDWTETEKKKATAAAQKKPPTQDALRAIAEERLLGAAANFPEPWKNALAKPYRKADGSRADYSMLAGQLNNYTKKNTFDYFIHKDLGGFLTRELDFYIKNELLDWNDIASLKNDTARLAPLLSKIEVIRSLGEKIIAFLSQLENFQKKLWLKKKFVTQTDYCLTLDHFQGRTEFLDKALTNDRQLQEWESLYKVDIKEMKRIRDSEGWLAVLDKPEFRYMMLDTSFFECSFKAEILTGLDGLDKSCNGLLVHSENFQALNLIQERYKSKIKCIYIDPPYNTASSSIPYKNDYRHSAWATLMNDRIERLSHLLPRDGAIFVSIDKAERTVLEHVMDSVFGEDNKVEELIWAMNTNNSQAPNYSTNHEYVLVYAKDRNQAEQDFSMFREPKPGYEEIMLLVDEINPSYPNLSDAQKELQNLFRRHKKELREQLEEEGFDWDAEKSNDPWKGIYNYNKMEYRDSEGKIVAEPFAKGANAKLLVWREDNISMPATKQADSTRDPDHVNYRYYNPVHPVTGKACPHPKSGWKFPYDRAEGSDRKTFKTLDADGRIAWGDDESKIPQLKRYLHEVESNISKSIFSDYSDGEKQTSAMFGRSGMFLAPKHADFVSRFILQAAKEDSIILDCFGGSGSTAHAVIKLNKADNGKRKYVLVEMGAYFDTVLKPRVIKAAYSQDWRAGSPTKHTGVSHIIKTLRLESYEDALGNLEVSRPGTHGQLFGTEDGDSFDSARESYILNYMLSVETRGSQSLLNARKFVEPTEYKLDVRSAGGDETKPINVDLLETFNYLLGLEVEHIAAPIHFEAELNQGEYGRWQAKVKRSETGKWWFRTVYGTNRAGQQVLVVWRNLPSVIDGEADGIQKDNAVLDAVLIQKLSIRMTESQDDEIDVLYVNGDHNISIPRSRKGEPMEQARIQLIEEAFHRLMFAGTEAVL
ncbi:site-specific DNA-methyltransferase [Marinobacter sp.]|uniref:site-specific DNA-methyltransferase n=1 Tax=Marinobacter sp. TaxID=50741 RepID=UPI003A95AC10